MCGTKPNLHKFVRYPLEQGYYQDLDTSKLLDYGVTHKYQSLIGSLKKNIVLGIFFIYTYVMKMSSFRYAPHQVHMDLVKRIYAYLDKHRNSCIRVWTEELDYSVPPDPKFD